MRSAALAEVAVHGLHLALFGAGLVGLAVLLWVSRPRRRPGRSQHEQARVDALRAAAREGTLAGPATDSSEARDERNRYRTSPGRWRTSRGVAQTDEVTAERRQ